MAQPVQEKYEESNLYKIRHSAAHVMAQAVMEMFPDGKVTIGPPVENGFYYDFDLPRNLTPEDLEKIERRMRQIIAGRHDFQRQAVSAEEARQIFRDQPYKLELIAGLEQVHHHQAETDAEIGTAAAALPTAVEPVEDLLQVVLGDSVAGVADRHPHRAR